MMNVSQIMKYLRGVHTINLSNCNKITDQGLEYLKGVKIITGVST